MKEYMDSMSLALDNTLLRFVSEETSVFIPSRIGDLDLTRLGNGSVIDKDAIQLTVAEGYTDIFPRAFAGCPGLRKLILPASLLSIPEGSLVDSNYSSHFIQLRRHLTPSQQDDLLDAALPVGNGQRLLSFRHTGLSGLSPLEKLGSSFLTVHPDMRTLFFCGLMDSGEGSEAGHPYKKYKESWKAHALWDTVPCLDLRNQFSQTEEYTVILSMLRAGEIGYRHPGAEEASDLRIRFRKEQFDYDHPDAPLSYVCFDRPDLLNISRAYFFAPALYPIRYEGETLFLYSRQYLTGQADCPYAREDVCIMSREGLVTSRAKSERVYAKARLMMLL